MSKRNVYLLATYSATLGYFLSDQSFMLGREYFYRKTPEALEDLTT